MKLCFSINKIKNKLMFLLFQTCHDLSLFQDQKPLSKAEPRIGVERETVRSYYLLLKLLL